MNGNTRALVVDLDGTLLKSDLVVESACALLRENPLQALSIAAWLVGGKAALKRRIAERTEIDPSLLPYNEAVVERIRAVREAGRPVYLVSASDERYVGAIARHLELFDGWFGSDGKVNLKGEAKATKLAELFGQRGFDYVGNGAVDLPVWRLAHTAVVVSRSSTLARRASAFGSTVECLVPPAPSFQAWLALLRPHQWTKNVLVAVALFTAHSFTLGAVARVLLAFAAFSLCASSVYILNDIVDLRADRSHPSKRRRPFASGAVPLLQGALLAPLLLAGGATAALALSLRFAAMLATYYGVTLAYSFVLKRKMMIDVVTLAGLYTIRVIAGAVAVQVSVSPWILAFSMFIFLSLALVKRYSELATRLDARLPDPTNRNYRVDDLPVVLSLAAAAGYSAVIVFSLYLASDAVAALYRWPELLWLAVPLLVYWISRLLVMAHRRLVDEDPIVFALRDRVSLVTGAILLALTMVAYLVQRPADVAGSGTGGAPFARRTPGGTQPPRRRVTRRARTASPRDRRDVRHALSAVGRRSVAVGIDRGAPDEGVHERRLEQKALDARQRREPDQRANPAGKVVAELEVAMGLPPRLSGVDRESCAM